MYTRQKKLEKKNSILTVLFVIVILLWAAPLWASGGQEKGAEPAEGKTEASGEPSKEEAIETHIITDSIGREVEIPYPITSAVVANAYNTEIINGIGALEHVIGVDYNIFQDKESWKNRFTEDQVIGQRDLNYEKIIELNPQVLILTGNGAHEEAETQLAPFGIKVVVVDAYFTDQFRENCELLGSIFGKEAEAQELAAYFMDKLDYINEQLEGVEKKTVYFEYRRIGNTTIPGNYFFNMVEYSGADNIFKDAANVEIDPEAVVVKNPAYIVKVSAPNVYSSYFPPTVKEHQSILDELKSRPGWDEIDAIKNDEVLLLSHYAQGGASKLVGTMYIAKFLYPEQLQDLHPEKVFQDWLVRFQGLEYIKGHTYPAFTFED